MYLHPAPITEENFSAVWRYARRKHYWARKKSVIRKSLTFVTQLLFFTVFLILTYGVIYEKSQGLVRSLLDQAPALEQAWQKTAQVLFAGAAAEGARGLRMLLCLYGIPLLAALVIFLAVGLLYHPRAAALPQDKQDQARELWVLSQHIQSFQEKEKSPAFGFFGMLYGLMVIGFFTMYLFYYYRLPEISRALQKNMGQAPLYFALGVLGIFLAYWIMSIPLNLVLLPLYRSWVPKNFYKNCDLYYEQSRRAEPGEAPQKEA